MSNNDSLYSSSSNENSFTFDQSSNNQIQSFKNNSNKIKKNTNINNSNSNYNNHHYNNNNSQIEPITTIISEKSVSDKNSNDSKLINNNKSMNNNNNNKSIANNNIIVNNFTKLDKKNINSNKTYNFDNNQYKTFSLLTLSNLKKNHPNLKNKATFAEDSEFANINNNNNQNFDSFNNNNENNENNNENKDKNENKENDLNLIKRKTSFLSKEKRMSLKDKFKKLKSIIIENQNNFVNEIKKTIKKNDIQKISELMLNENNKKFYKFQLESNSFLSDMLISNKIEMLKEILLDKFYKFDEIFIFHFLAEKMKKKNFFLKDKNNIILIIKNTIENNLYKKSLTLVLGWIIISLEEYDLFKNFYEINKNEYEFESVEFNNFDSFEDLNLYFEDSNSFSKILCLCLKEKLEILAFEFVIFYGNLENNEVIDDALKYNCHNFLRYIWETTNNFFNNNNYNLKNYNHNDNNNNNNNNNNKIIKINKTISNSPINKRNQIFFKRSSNYLFNNGIFVFNVSDLLEKIYSKNCSIDLIHNILTSWNYLDRDNKKIDNNLVQTLFKYKSYDEIAYLLKKYPKNLNWKISTDNFKEVIKNFGLELINLCLKENECLSILEKSEIQELIIDNYFSMGERIYYGAEMISYIKEYSLDLNLVEKFLNNIISSIKNKSFINCFNPILTCLLLYEIIQKINGISGYFQTLSNEVNTKLMNFCKNINEVNPKEEYIKYLLSQRDSRGRSAYEIASQTEAFTILESPEVGAIVNKMWIGKLRYDGILSFSSLSKFIENPTQKGGNPFKSFEKFDNNKTYFHQLNIWKESCSLRFYAESLNTILLITLYNLFIYYLVIDDEIMKNYSELTKNMKTSLLCYIIWVSCIVVNIPLNFLFCFLNKKRKFKFDFLCASEILLGIFAYCILIDTQKIFPKFDENHNQIESDGKSDIAFILRASILSINDILVWLRITRILLTYKELGPLIRMIYLLSIETGKYLLIYLIIMICGATFYTTVFYKASSQFNSFSVTITTLFQAFLNNSKCFNFDKYNMFGAVMVLLFVTVVGLILVNMLIGLLSNEYTKLSKVVDAAHRGVLINYYKKYKWDKNFGFLIFLSTPLNVINYLTLPINYIFKINKIKKFRFNNSYNNFKFVNDDNFDFLKDINVNKDTKYEEEVKIENMIQQEFNNKISKIYFLIFYFPIIFILESFLSIFLIPICFFIGIFTSITKYYSQSENSSFFFHFIIIFLWIIFGIPFLFFRYFIDLYYLITSIFNAININEDEKKYKEFLQICNFFNFIEFIHKREKIEQNNLHTLFADFLEYEKEKNKENSSQLNKINNYERSKIPQRISIPVNIVHNINNKNFFSFRKNLIIIQILGNFLFDNNDNNNIVDIEKMKILLPMTINIDNAYIKRLINTNLITIRNAVNKKKNKTKVFLQHKLLNKIVGSIIRLDKVIDTEGNTDPFQNEEFRKNNNFEIDEKEDDFYTNLNDYLKKMIKDLHGNIRNTENKEDDNK